MAANASFDIADDERDAPRVEDVVHVIKVGKARYAVGLLWQDVEEQRDVAAEARRTAARPGVERDLFVVRSGGAQYGLGSKACGHAKGMPSLAGRLADAHPGSWIGLFPVDGGFYLLAVNSDLIGAQTDKFYRDEIEARAQFDEAHDLVNDWSDVFCPPDHDVHDSKPADLEALLTGKSPKLQSIDRVSSYIKYGAIAAVALLALLGAQQYSQWQSDASMKAEMDRIAEESKKLIPLKKAEKPRPAAPWDGRYKATSYIEGCVQGMKKAVLDIPGWRTRALACDSGNAMVQQVIERQAPLGNGGGTMNWIRWSLDRHDMHNASVSPLGGDQFQVSWAFPDPDRWKPDVGITPTVGKVRFYLQSQFEEDFTVLTFGTPKADEFYRTLDWTFPTSYDPRTFVKILDRLPGAVVNKISMDLGTFAYKVEGSSFEEIPVPAAPSGQKGPGAQKGPGIAAAPSTPATGRPNDVVSR